MVQVLLKRCTQALRQCGALFGEQLQQIVQRLGPALQLGAASLHLVELALLVGCQLFQPQSAFGF